MLASRSYRLNSGILLGTEKPMNSYEVGVASPSSEDERDVYELKSRTDLKTEAKACVKVVVS